MPREPSSSPALIALDWGTSSLRAWLLGDDGAVLDSRTSADGIMQVTGGAYARVYIDSVGDWLAAHAGLPAIACGMVGSRSGWQETPYVTAPVAPKTLAEQLVPVATEHGPVHIVPGVSQPSSAKQLADVMRGEETQILGALSAEPGLAASAWLVTPGTHSKWVDIRDARIAAFATYMTGELYATLTQHSILGRQAYDQPPADDTQAFELGVTTARDAGPAGGLRTLFSARSRWLAGEITAAGTRDYLSGLLIGEELRVALAGDDGRRPIGLIGDAALCARYQRALAIFDRAPSHVVADAARHGLWHIAVQAGLPAKRSA